MTMKRPTNSAATIRQVVSRTRRGWLRVPMATVQPSSSLLGLRKTTIRTTARPASRTPCLSETATLVQRAPRPRCTAPHGVVACAVPAASSAS